MGESLVGGRLVLGVGEAVAYPLGDVGPMLGEPGHVFVEEEVAARVEELEL